MEDQKVETPLEPFDLTKVQGMEIQGQPQHQVQQMQQQPTMNYDQQLPPHPQQQMQQAPPQFQQQQMPPQQQAPPQFQQQQMPPQQAPQQVQHQYQQQAPQQYQQQMPPQQQQSQQQYHQPQQQFSQQMQQSAEDRLDSVFQSTTAGASERAAQGQPGQPGQQQQPDMKNFNDQWETAQRANQDASAIDSLSQLDFQEYTQGDKEEEEKELQRLDKMAEEQSKREDFVNIAKEEVKKDSVFLDALKNLTITFFLFVIFDLKPIREIFKNLITSIATNFMDVGESEFTYTSLAIRGCIVAFILYAANKLI